MQTETEIVTLCAPALATTHSSKLSSKYLPMNTSDIIGRFLESDGDWTIAKSWTRKARKGEPEHAAHVVNLRSTSLSCPDPRDPTKGIIPEVIIENSHNGTAALSFALGAFAQVCSNGLCIAYGPTMAFNRRHSIIKDRPFSEADAAAILSGMRAEFIESTKTIERMASRDMFTSERHELAKAMILARWPDRTDSVTTEAVTDALAVRRDSDNRTDLWTTFNILQENVCGGAVRFKRKSQNIRNALKYNSLNAALWENAIKFLN